MGTYRHTGVGNATTRTQYAAAGQVQDGSLTWCGTAGGTADALTLTPSPAITAYAAGQKFRFIAGADPNTGAATVAISGLAAQDIQNDGAALTAGQIAAGKLYEITYDGTAFQISPLSLSLGTAATRNTGTAADQVPLLGTGGSLYLPGSVSLGTTNSANRLNVAPDFQVMNNGGNYAIAVINGDWAGSPNTAFTALYVKNHNASGRSNGAVSDSPMVSPVNRR
jgi:hypothetical protein